MKTMAGSMRQVVERLDELAATRGRPGASAAAPPGRRARRATRWSSASASGMELAVVQQRHELDPTAALLGDGHVVAQLDGPVRLDDHLGGTADACCSQAPNSSALDTVADRHTNTTSGAVQDDHLLPHRPPVGVLEVVDLVQHDQAQARPVAASGRRACCAGPRSS